MAVLVEGFSVVVRREAVEQKFPGGMDAYVRQLLNETYCVDGYPRRVVGADRHASVEILSLLRPWHFHDGVVAGAIAALSCALERIQGSWPSLPRRDRT